jgi:outer membrane protein TolC
MTKFLRSFLLLIGLGCFAQQGRTQDSLLPRKVLSPEDFTAIIKTYHPVLRQAELMVLQADANVTLARSGFDPQFTYSNDQKTFNGTDYYQYNESRLKVPTWFGIELNTGIENNAGNFINSEYTLGQSSYVGIAVPLARNLVMDKRRATLQQAKIFSKQSLSERANTINNLLFEAYDVYWSWAREHYLLQILTEAVTINEARFALVKTGYRQGDRPAIDTTEALAQLQLFRFEQAECRVRLKNTAVELSNYLWMSNNTYYEVDESVKPDDRWNSLLIDTLSLPPLNDLLYTARIAHPKLRVVDFKLQQLEIDRKLKFQNLLPVVNVKANLLNKGFNVWKGVGPGFYENNNKFGVDIGIPLRLSEGRGSYKMAKLKLAETELAFKLQEQEIANKVRQYYNEVLGLQQQVRIYEQATNNYATLVRGEDVRFKAGESSLFLLNTRENKLLEARQKLVTLKTKFFKSRYGLQWASGQLQ